VHRLYVKSSDLFWCSNHLVTNGKCPKFVKEIRRLIAKKVDRTLDAKTSMISFNASKTFLVSYLFHDSSNGTMEHFKGEQLEHIQDKFYELNSPNVHNLVLLLRIPMELCT